MHGSYGREAATGRGTVFATRELLRATGAGNLSGKSFVIQACILGPPNGSVDQFGSDLMSARMTAATWHWPAGLWQCGRLGGGDISGAWWSGHGCLRRLWRSSERGRPGHQSPPGAYRRGKQPGQLLRRLGSAVSICRSIVIRKRESNMPHQTTQAACLIDYFALSQ